MTSNNQVQLFENRQIQSVWDTEQEKWYFSVHDVVEALTNSADPQQYVKKMRSRDQSLNANWVQFIPRLKWYLKKSTDVGLSMICYTSRAKERSTSCGDFHPNGRIGKLL